MKHGKQSDCYIGRTISSEACKLIKTSRQYNMGKMNIQPTKIDQWKQYHCKEFQGNRIQYITCSPTPVTVQGHQISIKEKKVIKSLRTTNLLDQKDYLLIQLEESVDNTHTQRRKKRRLLKLQMYFCHECIEQIIRKVKNHRGRICTK